MLVTFLLSIEPHIKYPYIQVYISINVPARRSEPKLSWSCTSQCWTGLSAGQLCISQTLGARTFSSKAPSLSSDHVWAASALQRNTTVAQRIPEWDWLPTDNNQSSEIHMVDANSTMKDGINRM